MEGVNLSVNLAALPRPPAPASARPASGIPRRTSASLSSPTRPYSARPKGAKRGLTLTLTLTLALTLTLTVAILGAP